jgi:hypothetical protein
MEVLHLEATEDTPEIILDKENEVFEISGRSLPEDVNNFYQPFLNWIEAYTKNPNKSTIFKFRFSYFNTASSKIILDILTMLEKMIEEGHNVVVRWYFQKEDEDMLEAGEEFAEMVEVPFELVTYKGNE